MTINLNFPSDLNIKPLAAPGTLTVSNESKSPEDPMVDSRFNDAAQEDAIRIYGIAGRVWSVLHILNIPTMRDLRPLLLFLLQGSLLRPTCISLSSAPIPSFI